MIINLENTMSFDNLRGPSPFSLAPLRAPESLGILPLLLAAGLPRPAVQAPTLSLEDPPRLDAETERMIDSLAQTLLGAKPETDVDEPKGCDCPEGLCVRDVFEGAFQDTLDKGLVPGSDTFDKALAGAVRERLPEHIGFTLSGPSGEITPAFGSEASDGVEALDPMAMFGLRADGGFEAISDEDEAAARDDEKREVVLGLSESLNRLTRLAEEVYGA
ncbi:hypothetical protein [uncultured Methylobacterium sp.]|jgi:hypothetical protein|uniref:hypothetical protein n=1 Tax=uncultured Methylobacterium sp. TaxID=157278 RepID=UPI0026176EBE|nr:hypothetical protein [uncultured Methylobacterium sp.]